jgi:geranylgeranyl pyrophosphate synthase
MNSYYQKALESLDQLSLSSDKKEVLKSIAESLLYRED